MDALGDRWMERMCWWWIVVPGRWWRRYCCCGGGDDGVDDALGEWSGGWSWMMMAWPRPFDSADITYASAPSHQQQGQHPSTACLGVAGTQKRSTVPGSCIKQ